MITCGQRYVTLLEENLRERGNKIVLLVIHKNLPNAVLIPSTRVSKVGLANNARPRVWIDIDRSSKIVLGGWCGIN